jgi:hypothetical protein
LNFSPAGMLAVLTGTGTVLDVVFPVPSSWRPLSPHAQREPSDATPTLKLSPPVSDVKKTPAGNDAPLIGVGVALSNSKPFPSCPEPFAPHP